MCRRPQIAQCVSLYIVAISRAYRRRRIRSRSCISSAFKLTSTCHPFPPVIQSWQIDKPLRPERLPPLRALFLFLENPLVIFSPYMLIHRSRSPYDLYAALSNRKMLCAELLTGYNRLVAIRAKPLGKIRFHSTRFSSLPCPSVVLYYTIQTTCPSLDRFPPALPAQASHNARCHKPLLLLLPALFRRRIQRMIPFQAVCRHFCRTLRAHPLMRFSILPAASQANMMLLAPKIRFSVIRSISRHHPSPHKHHRRKEQPRDAHDARPAIVADILQRIPTRPHESSPLFI